MEDLTNETLIEDPIEEASPESVSYNNLVLPYSGWNDQILSGFTMIVSDLPSHYGYIAFEDSGTYYLFSGSQYSYQDNHLYFGSDCKVAIASVLVDSIDFQSMDYPDFNYTLDSGTLVYSNLIPGYPDLKADHISTPLLLGFCLVITSFWAILNRSSRR